MSQDVCITLSVVLIDKSSKENIGIRQTNTSIPIRKNETTTTREGKSGNRVNKLKKHTGTLEQKAESTKSFLIKKIYKESFSNLHPQTRH